MLRGIRTASENWLGRIVMAVVMAVLTGSFAIWGINDIFRGFGRTSLASIGGAEISADQFRQAYNDRVQAVSQQLGRPIPPDQATALGLDRQVLGELMARAGLDQRIRQMRLAIPDDEVARQITSNPNLQGVNGQFDRARFEQLLRNSGYNEQRFINDQRLDALRHQLIDSISGDVTAPKAWSEAINRFQNEARAISYIALGPAQAGDIPQPTPDQLVKYFDERKILFRAPEYRKIETVTVTPAELAKWMTVSDDDVKAAYDKARSRLTSPERRHVQQIVFPTLGDAQAAADRIKAGTPFATIASERGLADKDIDLGTVPKAGIVDPAVGNAVFALKEGEVTAPVQGQFGAVLATVLQIEPETVTSFADAAPALRAQIALERAKTQVQDIHDKIEDDRAGGASLAEAAQRQKLAVTTFDVDRSGRDASDKPVFNIPHGPDVLNAAFRTDVGVDNDPIEVDGGFIWYNVAGITPARTRNLDEVKNAVEERWRNDEIASRLKAKATELTDQIKGGATLDALATQLGVKVGTATDLKRDGNTGPVPADVVDAVFHTANDGVGSSQGATPADWIVFKVTGDQTPPLDPNSDAAKQIARTVQNQLSDELIGQYIAWLEDSLGTTVNPAAMAQALGNSQSTNGGPDYN
jgi:peptidyl-prolyl cis-trans isomerase D